MRRFTAEIDSLLQRMDRRLPEDRPSVAGVLEELRHMFSTHRAVECMHRHNADIVREIAAAHADMLETSADRCKNRYC